MATISTDKAGNRRVQFTMERSRKTIHLGKMPMKTAEAFKIKLEAVIAARITRTPLDGETARWMGSLENRLHDKLARAGLVPSRAFSHTTLGQLLDTFFDAAQVKDGTRTTYLQTRSSLEDHFISTTSIRQISALQAEEWVQGLRKQKLAAATIAKRVKVARAIFRKAERWKLIDESPFRDIKAGSMKNPARLYFVTAGETEAVLKACPDPEWRLIFALSRYGGLRCPSEHISLRWSDVNWERARFAVRATKTEHAEDGGVRFVPIFPELHPHLLAAFERAEPGNDFVITRNRVGNANLRTQLSRILKLAGLKPWPRLFHNLRASRQTELSGRFPTHVVCGWLGNSETVARDHYLSTTEDDYEKAVAVATCVDPKTTQKAAQQAAAKGGNEPQTQKSDEPQTPELQAVAASCDSEQDAPMTPRGFEQAPSSAGISDVSSERGSNSGSNGPDSGPSAPPAQPVDSNIAPVIVAWPTLPPVIRAGTVGKAANAPQSHLHRR